MKDDNIVNFKGGQESPTVAMLMEINQDLQERLKDVELNQVQGIALQLLPEDLILQDMNTQAGVMAKAMQSAELFIQVGEHLRRQRSEVSDDSADNGADDQG